MVGVVMMPAIVGNFHSPARARIVAAISNGGSVGSHFLARRSSFRHLMDRLSRSRR
jgi:hypothetical protein